MKQLNIKEMDKEEKELYQMLISKFNEKEMKRLAELMIIDAEKYHQERLKKNCDLDFISFCFIQDKIDFINSKMKDKNYTKALKENNLLDRENAILQSLNLVKREFFTNNATKI